jgi:hypothetical protein
MANRCILLVLFLYACPLLNAQQKVNGRIYSATTDSVIIAASVRNKTLKISSYSGRDGSYSIFADEGDTLVFSAIGFTPDTVKVSFQMLLTQYDVTLQMKIVTLEMVKITSSYYNDSINRRNYYQNIFKKQPGITGFSRPEKGFGVVLSPLSYLSNAAREKRALKKRLLQQDHDDYIDRSFPKEWVERLTGLKRDSLSLFMYRYRPSYTFCRKTDRDGMLIYINDRLKEFKKPKNKAE